MGGGFDSLFVIICCFIFSSITEVYLTDDLYIFKVYDVMIRYMYILWNDYHSQVNQHICHLTVISFFL